MRLEAGIVRATLEEELSRNLFLIYGMAAYISVRSEITPEEFDSLAATLMKQSDSLRNIAAAPDFVIRYVYPLEGNRGALGLNYREVPAQWPQALLARETGSMVVAGPIDLVQGGRGLAARIPVFTGEGRDFWGLVSSVIDIDSLLAASGLFDSGANEYALRGKDSLGEEGDIFFGPRRLFEAEGTAVELPVQLPNGNWILAAAPEGGWDAAPGLMSLIRLFVLAAIFIAYRLLVHLHIDRLDLGESERRLRAMSRATLDALVIINADDRVSFWNPAAERMFGYSEAEMKERRMHEVITWDEDMDHIERGMAHFRRTGTGPIMQQVREVRGQRRDGTPFPAELSVASFQLRDNWYAVGNIRDITARKEYEQQLKELATTDPLTGIANRRRFMELASAEFDKSRRYERPFALILLDLDHFKSINDTWGHDAGDATLAGFARSLQDSIRNTDFGARVGGEEFAVGLPETDMDSAAELAERVRKATEALSIDGFPAISLTVSIGIAAITSSSADVSQLLKQADLALYAAKQNGRNRVSRGEV